MRSDSDYAAAGASGGLDRRTFLTDPARAAAGLALAAALPAGVIAFGRRDGFAGADRLAAFLTGRGDLSPALVARAIAALREADGGIVARLEALAARIAAARLHDVEAFRASPLAADPVSMEPAMALIRALYLGRVGKGAGARVVSYENALAFRPTLDVTVIPTYARGGPGAWAEDPVIGDVRA